jgi:hypothetical protein
LTNDPWPVAASVGQCPHHCHAAWDSRCLGRPKGRRWKSNTHPLVDGSSHGSVAPGAAVATFVYIWRVSARACAEVITSSSLSALSNPAHLRCLLADQLSWYLHARSHEVHFGAGVHRRGTCLRPHALTPTTPNSSSLVALAYLGRHLSRQGSCWRCFTLLRCTRRRPAAHSQSRRVSFRATLLTQL